MSIICFEILCILKINLQRTWDTNEYKKGNRAQFTQCSSSIFIGSREYSLFMKKIAIFFYFLISENIFWYQIIDLLISENNFLISEIWIIYIRKCLIFLISRIRISNIKNNIFLYQKILYIFWHQKMIFWIFRNIFGYQKIEVLISENNRYHLISRIRISDIKKSFFLNKKISFVYWYQIMIFWYQKFLQDIKTAPHI